MTEQEQIRLVQEYVRQNFTDRGMCADFSIHNPSVRNRSGQPVDADGNIVHDREHMQFQNPHAHIMLTMRPLDEKGRWQAKTQIEYQCIRNGKQRGFTADEYKVKKEEGWEKQYKYRCNGKTVWMTATEGNLKKLERISRTPKTSRFGRRNPTVEFWNSQEAELA